MKRNRDEDSDGSRDSSPEPDTQRSVKSARSDASASTRDEEPTYGLFFGRQMACARLSELWRWRKSFKRVRMAGYTDIEAAYPFICACIEEPSIAEKLQVLVIDNDEWSELSSYGNGFFIEDRPPREAREGTHDALLAHVRGLGLSEAIVDRMVTALNFKRDCFRGVMPQIEDGGTWSNMEFASSACVILMSLCPNITTLHIDEVLTAENEHNAQRYQILGDFLLRNNFNLLTKRSLQKLTSVIVNPQGRDYWSSDEADIYHDRAVTDIMRCFHRLPALESFRFVGLTTKNASQLEFLPPGVGTFKKLRFDKIDLRGTMIGTMIRVARNLEELTLHLGGMEQPEGSAIWVHPKTIGKALLEQKGTLRVMDLDIEEAKSRTHEEEHDSLSETGVELDEMVDQWHRLDEEESSGPLLIEHLPNTRKYGLGIGSLHDFEALTHLSIQPEKLLGGPEDDGVPDEVAGTGHPNSRLIDMLPPSLEYLCLYQYKKGRHSWLDSHVEELMEKKAEKLPSLKEVKGHDEFVEPPDPGEDLRVVDQEGAVAEGEASEDEASENDDDSDDDDDESKAGMWKRPRPKMTWLKV